MFYWNLCSDTTKYKTPVVVSNKRPAENFQKKEEWRKLGVNVEALSTSLPDLEWLYSTISGPTIPPSGFGGKSLNN